MTTVVITGLGALTPLGNDVATTWQGLREGRSGIGVIDEDWASELPVHIAGSSLVDVTSHLSHVEIRRMDRSSQLAVIAAQQAWEDAGFTFAPATRRIPSASAWPWAPVSAAWRPPCRNGTSCATGSGAG